MADEKPDALQRPCPWCCSTEHLYFKIEKCPNPARQVQFVVCGSCAMQGPKPLGSFENADSERGRLEAIKAWDYPCSDYRRGLEDAAKIAEEYASVDGMSDKEYTCDTVNKIAAAIRAKGKEA